MTDYDHLRYQLIDPKAQNFERQVDNLCWQIKPGYFISLLFTLQEDALPIGQIDIAVLDRQDNDFFIIERSGFIRSKSALHRVPRHELRGVLSSKEQIENAIHYQLSEIKVYERRWDLVMDLVNELDLLNLAARLAMVPVQ